jgi:hypothetical protein
MLGVFSGWCTGPFRVVVRLFVFAGVCRDGAAVCSRFRLRRAQGLHWSVFIVSCLGVIFVFICFFLRFALGLWGGALLCPFAIGGSCSGPDGPSFPRPWSWLLAPSCARSSLVPIVFLRPLSRFCFVLLLGLVLGLSRLRFAGGA